MFALPLEAAPDSRSAWDDLDLIEVPTSLIVGSEECTQGELDAATSRLRIGEGRRIADFGHLQVLWHAEVIAPIIIGFLRSASIPA
jgi:pimeloyl-ACP methyl ester carboxylesterase